MALVLLLLTASAALAKPGDAPQTAAVHHWYDPLSPLVALILCSVALALFCYLFSVGFSAAMGKSGYPPNVARLGIWLGALLWGILFTFVLCVYVIKFVLPAWFLVVIALGLLFFGMVLLMTRRQITN